MDKNTKHLLIMILCCIAPFLVLLVIMYGFGIRNTYLYWAAIIICPLSHLIMMKYMDHGKKEGCH